MAKRKARVDDNAGGPIEGGPGASDSSSGGGAGAGIPDADTGMRAGEDVVDRGDVKEDKKRIFPEAERNKSRKGGKRD